MDFEVPADAANKPAFSSDEDLNPITFPSERDVPPKRIRVLDLVDDYDPAAEPQFPVPGVPPTASTVGATTPAMERAPRSVSSGKQAASDIGEAPAGESIPDAESDVASGAPHWMDAVAPPAPGSPASGWMEAITGEHAETVTETESHASPAPATSQFASDEPFFADDAAGESSQPSAWPTEEPAREAVSRPHAIEAPEDDQQIELDPEDPEPPLALKDPALEESPAVHVTPEPLLVEDEAMGPSEYGATPQDTAPLHAFLTPASESAHAERAGEPEFLPQHDADASSWGAAADEVDERTPTMPPPNREALAEIPFLTPPPEILHPTEASAAAADPAAVDAAVQKVLERLEPQLHEMLSQGLLKPLIENLLQGELAKKEK